MSGLPEITEVQRITLKPGDRIAIRAAGRITSEQASRIREIVTATWPGVPVLILDDSMSIEVVEDTRDLVEQYADPDLTGYDRRPRRRRR